MLHFLIKQEFNGSDLYFIKSCPYHHDYLFRPFIYLDREEHLFQINNFVVPKPSSQLTLLYLPSPYSPQPRILTPASSLHDQRIVPPLGPSPSSSRGTPDT